METNYIRFFQNIRLNHISLVGAKGANLGEKFNHHFPIPPGFCLTTEAYSLFIGFNSFNKEITRLSNMSYEQGIEKEIARQIYDLFINGSIPHVLIDEITDAVHILGNENAFAVRSSVSLAKIFPVHHLQDN